METEVRNLVVLMSIWLARVLTVQLLSLGVLMASSSGQTLESQQVTLHFSQATLPEVLMAIEDQTPFYFSYELTNLSGGRSIPTHYQRTDLRSVLMDLSRDHLVKFKRINKTIYVASRRKRDKSLVVDEMISDKRIFGLVQDAQTQEPLIGATVRIENTIIGTVTDLEGRFSLEVPDDTRHLTVSYIGYTARSVPIESEGPLIIGLAPVVSDLNEVVVVGYSAEKPKDFTGAIATVKGETINDLPVNSIEQALQGQVAGVQITNDGAPGGSSSVRIRGYATIGNNDPLYIIDGVPTREGINQFTKDDIESIQVLKDASATAIYGARAANGVIIINTKKGNDQGLKIHFDIQGGIQQPVNLPNLVNSQQYADMLWQAQINAGISPSNDLFGDGPTPVIPEYIDAEQTISASRPGTDWFDELFNQAQFHNYHVGIQSGKEALNNYSSFTYTDQEGIMEYTGFERYAFRTNTEVIGPLLKIGEKLSFSTTNTRSVPVNQALGSRMIHAYRINPVIPVYNIHGAFAGPVNGVQGALNPLGINYLDKNDRIIQNRIFGNIYAELEPLDGLSYRVNLGFDYTDVNRKDYDPKYKMGVTERGETIFTQSEASRFQHTFNNILQYKHIFGRHDASLLLGQEAIRFTSNEVGGVSSGFVTDEIDFIQLNTGNGQSSNFSGGSEWALASLFGRLNYQFDERYLFSASIRRDGSSRFSPDNRFAIFPAFSAGWRFSQEGFSERLSFLEEGKLRMSHGQSGNQEIGDFPSFSTYSADAWDSYYPIDGSNDKATIGFKPTRIGSDQVKWETTTQSNFGIDLVFSHRISTTVDYYMKTTQDILIQRPTLAIEGQAEAPYVNLGEMENKGWEWSLSYQSREDKSIQWGIKGNLSTNRNKVVQLADDVAQLTGLVNNTYSRNLILTVTEVGHPISQFYGHVADGIFGNLKEVEGHAQQEGKGIGRIRYRDINGDGTVDEKDKTFIGSPHPDFVYGISFNFSYKRLNFNMLIQGVNGNDIYNFTRYYTDFYYDLGNRHSRVLDAWSPSNPDTEIPSLLAVDVNNELRPSTYFIENGSYARIKNIQLRYELPLFKKTIEKIQFYVQAQNLLTITGYEGIDPEVGLVNQSNQRRNLDIGVDRGVYPNSRIFMAGLNIDL